MRSLSGLTRDLADQFGNAADVSSTAGRLVVGIFRFEDQFSILQRRLRISFEVAS